MHVQQEAAWIWTHYWQGGEYEASLSEAFGLSAAWRDYFSGFLSGARLLDLATGAGDVAERAARTARDLGHDFEIDAVDAASIPQPLVERLRGRGVRLIGETYLRALPFADGNYDGVFSQFGIEYGNRPAAFREAARVLRPKGRGLFIMHHRGSVVTRNCAERLSRHREVVGSTQCFAAARRVFICHLQRAPLPQLIQAETRFRNEVTTLRRRLGEPARDPNLVGVVSFLSDLAATPARYDPADALRRLSFAHQEIESWRLRQEAQQTASLEPAQLEAICEWLAAEGLEVQPPDVLRGEDGDIVAWALGFEKPA